MYTHWMYSSILANCSRVCGEVSFHVDILQYFGTIWFLSFLLPKLFLLYEFFAEVLSSLPMLMSHAIFSLSS